MPFKYSMSFFNIVIPTIIRPLILFVDKVNSVDHYKTESSPTYFILNEISGSSECVITFKWEINLLHQWNMKGLNISKVKTFT